MPAKNVDINKTLISHSEEDCLNEVTNQNEQPENQNYSKLQKLNDVVRNFFSNPKILPKSSDTEKNGQKNNSIKELTYAMCKKVKQNVFQSSDSNKIKYNLVDDKKQTNSFRSEFDEFDLKDYRRIEENGRLFTQREGDCVAVQKDYSTENLGRFDLKKYHAVDDSRENNGTRNGVRISSEDFNIKADTIINTSRSREDVFAVDNVPKSQTSMKDVDRASVNTSTESLYDRRHNLCTGSDEIIYRESKCLERRISLEYCNKDTEKDQSEYRIKEFIKTNIVSFSAPRLLSGSAVIINNDETNVKFSTFKPDVKFVEQAPTFARISNTDLHSGGQVAVEELTNCFNYPNYYGEDPITYNETSDTLYNHQQRFAKCTCHTKISTGSFSGGRLTSESYTELSLPELYATRIQNLELSCQPSAKEHFSGGRLVKPYEVENGIFLDFLSKTIAVDNDISRSRNNSWSNNSLDTAFEFGSIDTNTEKCSCQCHFDYNTNRRRYECYSETSLMSSDEAILSEDLCDLKYSQSNMKKQRGNSIFKAGFSLISKKKNISRSASEYFFGSWMTSSGNSNSMQNGSGSSRSSASVANDFNIPKSLSRYSIDPRSSAESVISSHNKKRISKTNSYPFFE